MTFKEKTIDDRSIGDILKDKRMKRGETIEKVEKSTRVIKKYLRALEANDFKRLPELVYAKNFVKALARHYKLDEDVLSEALVREMTAVTGGQEANHIPSSQQMRRHLVATPAVFKTSLVALSFIAILSYFVFSVHSIIRPPKLIVHSPIDSQVFDDQRVVLEGVTEPEVELTVNQEVVVIEPDGTFKETLNLPDGVSILRIAAKKKHSKEQEVYIKVVIEPREEAEPALSKIEEDEKIVALK